MEEFDDFNPFEDLGLTEHIQETYNLIVPMNKTTIILIRRPQLEEGNYGSESPAHTEIRYEIQMNINPVKAKPYHKSKEGISQVYSHEVYTNPKWYPSYGYSDKDMKVRVDEPFDLVLATDLIVFGGKTYNLSESFEDVSLNDQPLLWQHFFMKLIN